ncbi:hypothetical protein OH76DRAFT_540073 [Lentinus brumalis]|uniref:Uncharacterized protein n=1 Tax=Lentinus brumalis TaxID=2498619 RepID=A0A371D9L6_9APHY|nr:hypothetical protein OH76DRAFT_540073 [Polyporus brumalis]
MQVGPGSLDQLEMILSVPTSATNIERRKPVYDRPRQAAESVNATIPGAASNSGALDILLDGVNSFSLRTYQLLDERSNFRAWGVMTCIAQLLVPEPQVAVGALKVVIELELKRRDNDKKVNFVFLEMENMMSALLE